MSAAPGVLAMVTAPDVLASVSVSATDVMVHRVLASVIGVLVSVSDVIFWSGHGWSGGARRTATWTVPAAARPSLHSDATATASGSGTWIGGDEATMTVLMRVTWTAMACGVAHDSCTRQQ